MMRRQEFLIELEKKLCGLPQKDIQERLTFYSEMIDDRMEDGLAEETAVQELGTVDAIVSQILAEVPLAKTGPETVRSSRSMRMWEILLLVLGSPLWLSLLIALFAIALAVYAVEWSLIAAIWAVGIALGACAVGGVAAVPLFLFRGYWLSAAATLGIAMVCGGFAILELMGCLHATRAVITLTTRTVHKIKLRFSKKADAK